MAQTIWIKHLQNLNYLNSQNDLQNFNNWGKANSLHLHPTKTNCINYNRDHRPPIKNFFIDNVLLPRLTSVKDLGITFDSKLTCDKHIDSIVPKASNSVGFVNDSMKNYRNMKSKLLLYTPPI